jgi:hypothetical protein
LARDIGVERYDAVPSGLAARQTDITDDDTQPSPGDKELEASSPDTEELREEVLVARQIAELKRRSGRILLEVPVGRRCDHEMHERLGALMFHQPPVALIDTMRRPQNRGLSRPGTPFGREFLVDAWLALADSHAWLSGAEDYCTQSDLCVHLRFTPR